MLVLSRKKDEQIRIGESIVLTVVEIRGDRVKLGIEAPREVEIHRKEIWARIQQQEAEENRTAMLDLEQNAGPVEFMDQGIIG